MAEITRTELILMLNSGRTDFSDMDLSGLNLAGLDISDRNFHSCDFTGCNMAGIRASNIDASFSIFDDVILDNGVAHNINLFRAKRGMEASTEGLDLIEDTTMEDMQVQ